VNPKYGKNASKNGFITNNMFTIGPPLNPDYALGIVMRVESLIKQTLF